MAVERVATATMTPEEYLAWEEQAEERHEYIDGVVWPLRGVSPAHLTITSNMMRLLYAALDEDTYLVAGSDLRVWILTHSTSLCW